MKRIPETDGSAAAPAVAANDTLISLEEIRAAARRIAPFVQVTPIVSMSTAGLLIKAESLHVSGAFKIRGAFNSILSLSEESRSRGVVAHSSGNHAHAVAYAAHVLGVPATVVMPEDVPRVKLDGVRRWNAEVVLVGPASSERRDHAEMLANRHGYALIPPYDADAVLAATGTIGLEIVEAVPNVEAVFAPVGGGGLIGGLAAALKTAKPGVRVVGVEPALAADAYESFRVGRVVELSADQMARTIADGLRVQKVGRRNWPHLCAFVDEVVTVSEEEILSTIARVAQEARLVAEPSGATAVAAALARSRVPGRTVAILSGGNIERALFADILRGRVNGCQHDSARPSPQCSAPSHRRLRAAMVPAGKWRGR